MKSKSYSIKEKQVKDLVKEIKNSRTLMIISIKNVPSKQFQAIKKSIRNEIIVKVAKKNILLRVIKSLGKESILPVQEYINENCAFAFSNMEGYDLASLLLKKKTSVFAKAGQEAPEDIEIKEGPTDLIPGPAISELGSLGLQVAVENGKLAIKKSKVVINKGQTINTGAASILQKLNIQPFEIGLEPVLIYDTESEKIYTNININPEEAKSELISAASKALGFAQKIIYYSKETIVYFLAKANMNAEHLKKLEPKSEESKSEKSEQEEAEKTEEKETIIEKVAEKAGKIAEDIKQGVENAVEKVEESVKNITEKLKPAEKEKETKEIKNKDKEKKNE